MFVKMALRDRLDCLVDFIGLILLRLLLPCLPTALRLPSPNCFLRVCFPTLFAAVLNDFLQLITSLLSGIAKSNMSAPMRFAAGKTYLRKKELVFSQKLVQEPQIPFPSVFQPLYSMDFLLVLKQPPCSVVRVRIECWIPF